MYVIFNFFVLLVEEMVISRVVCKFLVYFDLWMVSSYESKFGRGLF